MPKITDICGYEILDSRGNPTIEVKIKSEKYSSSASVPSGASKGKHEALELRDNDVKRYNGMGVLKVIENLQTVIKPRILNKVYDTQKAFDEDLIALDGTENKNSLGANTILGSSLAFARLCSEEKKLPLYEWIAKISGNQTSESNVTPMFNVINGGLHGSGTIDIQEFLLIPNKELGFPKKLQMGAEVYQHLKKELKKMSKSTSLGDEGGFTPEFRTNTDVLSFLTNALSFSGYTMGTDIFLGLDCASSTYYSDGKYNLTEKNEPLSPTDYILFLESITKKYTLFSLEDPLSEDDWETWSKLTQKLGSSTRIVGDDLLVTNKVRLKKAIEMKSCNSILVKVNQIGTLTETLDVIAQARKAGFSIIISHRSGETPDDFIADLAVGTNADYIKAGAPARGERVAKYNRLTHIYSELKTRFR